MKETLPLIFDIRRFALYDGPGIRTVVFLKGCPLSCDWCHNPESIRIEEDTAFYPDRCVSCGTCRAVCPETAISGGPDRQIDRSRCSGCGVCAVACPALAIRSIGRAYQLEELLEVISRDKLFFDSSGGGVTFSGGEPTLWMGYLGEALRALKAGKHHIAIQTCGLFDYSGFEHLVLPFIDLVMFDLKFIDAVEHRKYTGQDNAPILANFRRLTKEAGSRVLPRVPLVPGITATVRNLLEIAALLAELGYRHCDLLSYNSAGIDKRRSIGMKLPQQLPQTHLGEEEEDELRSLFLERLLKPSEIVV